MKKLRRYDIYAPIQKKEEKRYTYDKAVKLVLETLNDFSPTLSEFAKRVFVQKTCGFYYQNREEKRCLLQYNSPKDNSVCLINFKGRTNDVFTMAHEIRTCNTQHSCIRQINIHTRSTFAISRNCIYIF